MNNKFQYRFLLSRDDARKHWLDVRRNLGSWLNETRRNQGLNLVDVADSLSLPITTLDDMESGEGKISLDRLLYVCRFYGVALDISLKTFDGVNYNRDDEHIAAHMFRDNLPKEYEDVK